MPNSAQQNAYYAALTTGKGVLYDALGNVIAVGAQMPAGAASGNVLVSDASGNLTSQLLPAASSYLRASSILGETISRAGQMNSSVGLNSGTLLMTAMYLPAGVTVGHLATSSGSAGMSSPTHWWFGLYDSNLNQLAVTADQTSTAWAANTYMSLAVATIASGASSTFTTTYTGLYYFGILGTWSVSGANIMAVAQAGTGITSQAPVLCGTSDTSQTTPPSFPHTATAITAGTSLIYGAAAT